MIWIRPAIESDIPWLLGQLRAFSAFYGTATPLFPDDDIAAAAVLEEQIETNPFFVAVAPGAGPIGFIAGALLRHPYNPRIRVMQELFWWVAPRDRGSKAGLLLLEHFIEYGREHADWVLMTLEAKSPVNPGTLERRGFRLHERSFLLETAAA